MKNVAIIDYGAGNLRNVYTALGEVGFIPEIVNKPEELDKASLLVLPGVGAFPEAMKKLGEAGLTEAIIRNVKEEKPLLGICLGMQMLFDKSYEIEETDGLGLIPGEIVPFKIDEINLGAKIPHMGWNELILNRPDDPFILGTQNGDYVYYVHSYYAKPDDFDKNVVAWSDYKVRVPGIVRQDNVIGTQFHPEKSSKVGMNLLKNLYKEFS